MCFKKFKTNRVYDHNNLDFGVAGINEEAAECLINQYNKFYLGKVNGQEYYIDGKKTLNENVADHGGLLAASKLYGKPQFTFDTLFLFFISSSLLVLELSHT